MTRALEGDARVGRRGVQGGRREVPTSRSHPPVLVSLFKDFAGAECLVPLHTPPGLLSPWPRSPPLALNAYRARGTPLPFVFLIREEETARRGSHLCASRPPHRHTCAVARARARVRAGGRAAAGARHEALEKRRCPRMYFLIIDFNDEGSRCQRHLGCWAE